MGANRRYRRESAKQKKTVDVAFTATSTPKKASNLPPASQASEKTNIRQSGARSGQNVSPKNSIKQEHITYFPPERYGLWPTQFLEASMKPFRLVPRQWRLETPHMIAVFLLVLFLYAYTTPRTVGLEDDGLFISNLHFFGVAHPPGYPIHTFLGGVFYHILKFLHLGTPAFRGHFFSGFTGAIACAAIYATVIMLVRGRIFGYLGGLSYGASQTFWSQAIIAEVYTMNAMFFFIVLALVVYYAGHSGRPGRNHRRLFCTIAFVYGLALANHYPILGLGSIGLGLLVISQFRHIISNIILGGVFLVLGAAPPFLWMVARSHVITPANFYGPIENFDQFLFYVLRKGYSGIDKQTGVGLEDKIIFFQALTDDMLWQFTPLGFIFVLLGFWAMARSRYNWLWLSLVVSWFMSSFLLVILLDFKAEFIWLAAFRVYHLLAFGIMAIWLGLGAAWFVDRLSFLSLSVRQNVGFAVTIVVVGLSIFAHWELNNRKNYTWAHDLAVAKLNSIERNAVLFTFDDLDLPVGYLHFVEGHRPDLKVYNDQGLVYGDRLYTPLMPDNIPPGAPPNTPNKSDMLRKFIDATVQEGKDNNRPPRPIFYHSARAKLYSHPKYGSDYTGFLRRVNYDNNQERIIFSDALLHWLNANIGIAGKISDRWTRHQHFSTVAQLVQAIISVKLHGVPLNEQWDEVIDRARDKNNLARLMTSQSFLAMQGGEANKKIEQELEWMDNFDVDKEELFGSGIKGQFYAIKASYILRLYGKEDPRYKETLLEGMSKWRSPDNAVFRLLIGYLSEEKKYCEQISLVEEMYPDVTKIPKELLRGVRQARKLAGNCKDKTKTAEE